MNKPINNEVLTACAGSGKTHKLIERFVSLLEQGVAPGEILAITFTRKAATEIHDRLLQKIQQAVQDKKAWAIDCYQRRLYSSDPRDMFRIYTFHQWFQVILSGKQWSSYQLIESDSKIRQLAWQQWLQNAKDSAPAEVLKTVLSVTSPSTLKKMLDFAIERINVWRLLPLATFSPPPKTPLVLTKLNNKLINFLIAVKDSSCSTTVEVKAVVEQYLQEGDFDCLMACFFTQKGEPRKKIQQTSQNGQWQQTWEEIINEIKQARIQKDRQATLVFDYAIKVLIASFIKQWEKIKKDQQVMTFNDLEYEAYCLIQSDANINQRLYRLSCQFHHILIDEFQDTNPLQWQILYHWLHAVHGSSSSPSVFIVGDEKQAIYLFRQGDYRLLAVARDFLKTYYHAEVSSLTTCRRLASPILTVINECFKQLFESFESHDSEKGINDKRLGRVEWHQINPLPRPVLARNPRNPLVCAKIDSHQKRQQWANAVVCRIKQILGHWVVGDDKQKRLCRESDIKILLPQSTHAPILLETIADAGLSATLVGGGVSFFDSLACQDILALMRFLLSPFNQDLCLAQVLKSPLFAIDDEQLKAIIYGHPEKKSLWSKLKAHRHILPTRCLQLLTRWRRLVCWGGLPTHDLLTKIFNEGAVLARYCAMVVAPKRQQVTNQLNALVDFSLSVQGGNQPLLGQFLEQAREAQARQKIPMRVDENTLQILTIHQAKGLEAPVVIIADTTFNLKHSAGNTNSVDCLINWSPGDKTPTQMLFRPRAYPRAFVDLVKQNEKQQEREYDNLLYVATTRARQALIIFSSTNEEREQETQPNRQQILLGAIKKHATEIVNTDTECCWSLGESLHDSLPSAKSPEVTHKPINPTSVKVGKQLYTHSLQRGKNLHQIIALMLSGACDADLLAQPQLIDKAQIPLARQLLDTPPLDQLRQSSTQCWIEPEFVDNGQIFRPDLLMIKEDSIWIVDYKSGGSWQQYQEKMNQYKKIVEKIYTPKTVRAALLLAKEGWREV